MAAPMAAPNAEQLQTLLNGPAGSPPTGVVPNFHNPPNINAFLPLTLTLALTFGTSAICMRMYTKLFIIRSIDYEDCMFQQLGLPRSVLKPFRCCHVRMGKPLG